jgi:hypothetical protein
MAGGDEDPLRRLVVDPGFHTARIWSLSVDAAQTVAATAGDDRTLRLWSVADGAPRRTIRLPMGTGDTGRAYALALDPQGKRVAVGGGLRGADGHELRIFVLDVDTGEVLHRLDGLPEICRQLAFSPDGTRLAAVLAGFGVRLWDAGETLTPLPWAGIPDQGQTSLAWAHDGRLAVTRQIPGMADISNLMLFRPDGTLETEVGLDGALHSLAFSPDGSKLAVASLERPTIDLFAAEGLERLHRFGLTGVQGQGFTYVTWQAGTNQIVGGGNLGVSTDAGSRCPLFRFDPQKPGQCDDVGLVENAVMSLAALADGGHLVATAGPSLQRLDGEGAVTWAHHPQLADMRGQAGRFSVSSNGEGVRFGYKEWARAPARFDLGALRLEVEADSAAIEPRSPPSLPIDLDRLLSAEQARGNWGEHELFRCAVPHPDGRRLLVGSAWNLYAYDVPAPGRYRLLWKRVGPDAAWAAEISEDGRLAVVVFHDGSIRWFRMEDGGELLAFLPLADRRNWVCWTPEGSYASTLGARGVLRWHCNVDEDPWGRMASAVRVDEIPELYRPAVLPLVIRELDEIRALGLVEQQKMRAAVRRHTGRDPAARLHLVAAGAGHFSAPDAEQALHLNFAEKDAQDVYAALRDSQCALYSAVLPQLLDGTVQSASRNNLLQALAVMREAIRTGGGRDVAIVHFSGHGAIVDGKLFLLPTEVDPRTGFTLKQSAIRFDEIRDELVELARHGRVLLLLDACRSGSATLDGRAAPFDAGEARAALATPNVSILASSGAAELSWEDKTWQNGAFTEVFLEALGVQADRDKDGVLDLEDIVSWMDRRLPELTGGRQALQTEMRFTGSLFAAGL